MSPSRPSGRSSTSSRPPTSRRCASWRCGAPPSASTSSCSTHMQARAIPGPWAAGERILVCVSEDPRAAGLVRYAKRLADRLHAPWTALYVETPAQPAAHRGASATASPRRCGSPSARRRGGHHPERRPAHRRRRDRLRAGQQRHPDHHRQIDALALVRDPARLGRARPGAPRRQHQRPRHRRRRARRRADPADRRCAPPTGPRRSIRVPTSSRWSRSPWRSASAELIQPWFGIENVDLVFLTAVVGVAVRFGLWPSLLASVAASLCYNFFFLPPLYTFTIADPTNVAAFVFFTIVAVIVSNLAARGAHAGGRRAWAGRAPPSRSMPSAASSRASARSTTCCGRPPIRSR